MICIEGIVCRDNVSLNRLRNVQQKFAVDSAGKLVKIRRGNFGTLLHFPTFKGRH
jgi:hypothetical protein